MTEEEVVEAPVKPEEPSEPSAEIDPTAQDPYEVPVEGPEPAGGCIPAGSCVAALREATRIAPNRRKTSDGICGDPSHRARVSDHNSGDAVDLSHDPHGGFDAHAHVEVIRLRHDPRVKYLISNRRIAGPGTRLGGWDWHPYTGSNPHTNHAHISIWRSGRDNTQAWFATTPPPPPPPPPPNTPPWPGVYLREGHRGQYVAVVQTRINAHSPPARRIRVDGVFGSTTDERIRQFQQAKRLSVDGIVGPATWRELHR